MVPVTAPGTGGEPGSWHELKSTSAETVRATERKWAGERSNKKRGNVQTPQRLLWRSAGQSKQGFALVRAGKTHLWITAPGRICWIIARPRRQNHRIQRAHRSAPLNDPAKFSRVRKAIPAACPYPGGPSWSAGRRRGRVGAGPAGGGQDAGECGRCSNAMQPRRPHAWQ